MDYVKEAFKRVKEDILNLQNELLKLNLLILDLKETIVQEKSNSTDRQTNQQTNQPTNTAPLIPTHFKTDSTDLNKSSTENYPFQDHPTENYPFQDLKSQNISISIRNRGVPTDRQTNQQTDKPTDFIAKNKAQATFSPPKSEQKLLIDSLSKSSLILGQLDAIKKEIRIKFKRLTNQEMLVFSSIYQFEDQGELVDYPLLSTKLGLSESSIRDYTQRIIAKGIPLIKEKINNKKILLHISEDLRKLASLETLLNLRDL